MAPSSHFSLLILPTSRYSLKPFTLLSLHHQDLPLAHYCRTTNQSHYVLFIVTSCSQRTLSFDTANHGTGPDQCGIPLHQLRLYQELIIICDFLVNPFARREKHDRRAIIVFRFLTLFTWVLVLVLSFLLTVQAPANGKTIWGQNKANPTPFSLNPEITSIYW